MEGRVFSDRALSACFVPDAEKRAGEAEKHSKTTIGIDKDGGGLMVNG
jgi:hypothetical protein